MKITIENFKKEVLNSNVPVLVDFYATWCGPCKMVSPIIEQIEKEMDGKVKVCKIDVDEARDLAIKYEIMSIPTFLVFKNGNVVEKAVGMRDREELMKLLEKVL